MIHNMRRPVPALLVSAGQREVLESVARSPSAPHREVVRARALLMAADGLANTAIARAVSASPASVSGWRARFAEEGLVKFAQVREGRGRKTTIPQGKIDEIVELTLNYRPAGETHWSCRTMAAATAVSKSTVQQVWLTFLKTIDRQVPKDLQIHLILDNYATHQHEDVRKWLDKHPRFHLHFSPASSSWLNLVELWFRELTDKALRRGVFHSVPDLVASIQGYIDAHNNDPKPYVWTATAESILAKVARGRIALEKVN